MKHLKLYEDFGKGIEKTMVDRRFNDIVYNMVKNTLIKTILQNILLIN